MDPDYRTTVLDVAIGESDTKPTIVNVSFCESSASVRVCNLTIHIPWSELVNWQAWLANRVEKEA